MAGTRKFNEAQVREIQAAAAAGESNVSIARRFGCNPETISRLKLGVTYRTQTAPDVAYREATEEEIAESLARVVAMERAAREGKVEERGLEARSRALGELTTEEVEWLRKLGLRD